jgi:hypothetical protein
MTEAGGSAALEFRREIVLKGEWIEAVAARSRAGDERRLATIAGCRHRKDDRRNGPEHRSYRPDSASRHTPLDCT